MGREEPYYDIEGRRYPRVTRILSIFREPDQKDWHNTPQAKEARYIGTQIHRLIEQDLKGERLKWPTNIRPELESCWEAYSEWKRLRKPKPLMVEKTVFSEQFNIAGTIDLWDVSGEGYLTDFKSSMEIGLTAWIQGQTYWPMLREWVAQHAQWNGRYKMPKYIRIVRLDKGVGMFTDEEQEFSPMVFQAFLHLKEIYMAFYGAEVTQGAAT